MRAYAWWPNDAQTNVHLSRWNPFRSDRSVFIIDVWISVRTVSAITTQTPSSSSSSSTDFKWAFKWKLCTQVQWQFAFLHVVCFFISNCPFYWWACNRRTLLCDCCFISYPLKAFTMWHSLFAPFEWKRIEQRDLTIWNVEEKITKFKLNGRERARKREKKNIKNAYLCVPKRYINTARVCMWTQKRLTNCQS